MRTAKRYLVPLLALLLSLSLAPVDVLASEEAVEIYQTEEIAIAEEADAVDAILTESDADAAVPAAEEIETSEVDLKTAEKLSLNGFFKDEEINDLHITVSGETPVRVDRMNHSYWYDSSETIFVNCCYDLVAVDTGVPYASQINSAFRSGYDEYLTDQVSFAVGDLNNDGYKKGQTDYYHAYAGTVTQNSDGIVSVKYDYIWYMGGVVDHGPSGITVSADTGKRLYLSDIPTEDGQVITLQEMKNLAISYYQNLGGGVPSDTMTINGSFLSKSLDDLSFYVKDNQIILCIAKYELTVGAAGSAEIPTGIYYKNPAQNVNSDHASDNSDLGSDAYTEAKPTAPILTLSSDVKTASVSGDYSGLYARVALILDNGGVTGLYVTQAMINSDGTIIIPEFMVPGLTVKGVNVALVPTLADIQSSTPNVAASAFKMLNQ